MAKPEVTEKKSKANLIIIILVVLILIVVSTIGYFLITGKKVDDIAKKVESHEEYTVLLEEFVVNLSSESSVKNYLKVEVALMYIDEKHGEIIELNVNKVRDIIIKDLRDKNAQEILNEENSIKIKKEIMSDVNAGLKEEIVKDVYFTNMIVQ